MILNTRRVYHDQSGWEKLEVRLRTWNYSLIHELLQSQMVTSTVFKLLLLIEGFQFFWFAIDPDFSFLWQTNFATWIRDIVKYFQFDALLERDVQTFFIAVLYLVFVIQIFMILLGVFTAHRLATSQKKTSTILAYSLKILSVYGLLLNTVLALPFYEIFLAGIICHNNDQFHGNIECYQGIYFAHLVCSIIGIVLLTIQCLMFILLYIDLNPFSKIPFACPQSRLNLLKLSLKILLCLYSLIDYKRSADKVFIVLYAIYWLLICVLRYRQTPYYNRSVHKFMLAVDSFLFWSCIISIVQAFINTGPTNSTGLFYLFIGGVMVSFTFISICHSRSVEFRRLLIKNLKRDTDVEMYINTVFHLIENRDKHYEKMALEGILKHHIKYTNKKESDDVAYALAKDFFKDEEAPEKLWYTWVKSLIVDGLERYPKSPRLHLLHAYISREKLHNKFKALFEMMITEENKPNIEEEFSLYRYKNLIEEEMIESDARTSESKGVDVNIIVHFQNKFVAFQAVIEKAVELHLDFWRELLETNPDIQKLQGLGSHITHSVEETSDQFKKLNEINPNHIKMLQIYGNFLKDIVNDDVEGQRILEKAEYVDKSAMVNKQFIDNDRLKYGENSNTCILTCSGNFNSMGLITNVNNEINRVLNFAKSELVGQNISRILPKILADLHDSFMRRYFETSEEKIIGMERTVFPVSKSGYVVPCSLMIKVLPNLDEGIRLVGFLKDIEKDSSSGKNPEFDAEEQVHYILYSGDTGQIHGITPSCKQEFGIPSSLVYGASAAHNEFTIDAIFPELLTHNIDELKSAGGVLTTLDTSSILQNYMVAQVDSEGSHIEEQEDAEKEKKYRKTKVRAVMIQDESYGDSNIKVLKFVEVQDEMREKTSQEQQIQEKQQEKNAEDHEATKGEHAEEEHENQEANQSDANSSLSGGDAANEEIRTLKDFKALISEKTTPKSIKILSRAVVIVFAMLVTLTSVELSLKFNQESDFNTGVSSIIQAYERHNLMAEINYRIRKLERIAVGWIQDPTGNLEWELRNDLVTLIDNLSADQFSIMKDDQTLSSAGTNTADSSEIMLQQELDNGETEEERIFTDSVFQYITAASSIRNSTLANLATNSLTDSTRKNFFFVRRNGLGPLRNGSEATAGDFYSFYNGRTSKYNTDMKIILILGILVVILSQFVLIPIVFSVHKTNNRVLSLFGFIPLSEISELAAKCERYMQNYLEDHKEKKDYSFEASEEDIEPSNRSHGGENTYLEVSQNPEQVDGDSVHQQMNQTANHESVQLDVSERMDEKPIGMIPGGMNAITTPNKNGASQRSNANQMQKSMNPPTQPNDNNETPTNNIDLTHNDSVTKQPLKTKDPTKVVDTKKVTNQLKEEEKRLQDADADAEFAQERSNKLLNSKDNRKSKVILQFSFIGMLFIIFFIVDYTDQVSYLNNVETAYTHLQLSCERMPDVRYLLAFTIEELCQPNLTSIYGYAGEPWVELRVYYNNEVQLNDKLLRDSQKNSYPSQFESYLSMLNSYNNENTCSAYYTAANGEPNGEANNEELCVNVANGLITKGLSVAVTTVALNSYDVLTAFNQTEMTNNERELALNSTRMVQTENITATIMPAMSYLINNYESSFDNFLSARLTVDKVKFTIFILWSAFVFGVLWVKYLKSLNDKIFRTKGMLNMIPMEIISKNEQLKNMFVSGDILQAVK